MNTDKLKLKLGELDIEPSLLDDIVSKISEMPKKNETKKIHANTEIELKVMLNETEDWHERARIAARIISLNLE